MKDFNLIKTPEFLEEATKPAAQEIGKTLGNIFYAIFNPINYNVQKLRIRQADNLKKYEQDIKNGLSQIPEEQLIEPKLSIIGPALEASKYYIEEDEIREMFAKLITSSVNSNTVHQVHPSFIETIKQLAPLDAQILKELAIYKEPAPLTPVVTYRFAIDKTTPNLGLKRSSYGYDILKNAVWFPNIEASIHELTSSIQNLFRLGIIDITYESIIEEESLYLPFTEGQLFQEISDHFDNFTKLPKFEGHTLRVTRGIIEATSYGKSFSKTCINSASV